MPRAFWLEVERFFFRFVHINCRSRDIKKLQTNHFASSNPLATFHLKTGLKRRSTSTSYGSGTCSSSSACSTWSGNQHNSSGTSTSPRTGSSCSRPSCNRNRACKGKWSATTTTTTQRCQRTSTTNATAGFSRWIDPIGGGSS